VDLVRSGARGKAKCKSIFYFKKKCYNNRFAEVSLLINAVKNSIACRFVASGQHNRNGQSPLLLLCDYSNDDL
jgi:hypothetical protein